MDYDALVPSLSDRVRALEAIIDGLDARTEWIRRQLLEEARAEVIMRRALTARVRVPSPRHAAPRREWHGLHVVHGTAVAAAVLAVRWSWRAHRAVMMGAVLAVARHLLGW